MDDKKKVAVIIPFYKYILSTYENISVQQCFKVLSAYHIIAIKPISLILPEEATKYPFFKTVSFDNEYFKNIEGYNRLMLDSLFYKEFLVYEHILIYQLDAFVFRDELNYWCDKGFDYIGAPWIKSYTYPAIIKPFKRLQYYLHTRYNILENDLPSKRQFEYKVGNGGFSLRRTKLFYNLCISNKNKIGFYNSKDHHLYNEDIFWSVEVNRKKSQLNIPGYKTGLKFSIEFEPERALKLNNHQLPFGCHAWDKKINFWRPFFEAYNYAI